MKIIINIKLNINIFNFISKKKLLLNKMNTYIYFNIFS